MDFARGGGYIENALKSRAESVLNHPRFPSVKKEFRLMRALAGLPVDRTPVWFMRQAGRFMPKYRALRARYSMLEVCESAELSARVTFLPLEAYPGLDAAIIFSDLLLLFKGMGPGVAFLPDEGPKVLRPIRRASDVARLKLPDPRRDLRPVLDAIRIVKSEVAGRVPLLGFGGAPFTLASYLIEGGGSKHFLRTKRFMAEQPKAWHRLLDTLSDAVLILLGSQVKAGADAVQLFDSWVGCLSPADYRTFVLPHSRKVLSGLKDAGIPAIHFGTGTGELLDLMEEAGGDVMGVDWRTPLSAARRRLKRAGIMGNLDPAALFAPKRELLRRVDEVLKEAGKKPGYIFNLGHGVLPGTPMESLQTVIDRVHRGR